MIKIAPSILAADFSVLGEQVQLVEQGGADLLHIDIMDGHFVPNITFGPMVVESIRKKSRLIFDVHLMIENPEHYIADFAKAGADIITVHVEATRHLHRCIQLIKQHNVKAGIALNPASPLMLTEHVFNEVDMMLLMTVNPGFGGQNYISEMTKKITALRKQIVDSGKTIDLEIDGGVGPNNIYEVTKEGANVIVAGSAIYHSGNVAGTIKQMKELAFTCERVGFHK